MDREPILLENNVSPGHPLAELATLALGIALCGLGLLLAVWLLVEATVRWLPFPVEQHVFGSTAASASTESDPRSAALFALLQRLSRHAAGPAHVACVGVVEGGEPNAFALPGGTVLVTRSLLERAASENELAFVLGHELGHVEARDPLRALGRGVLGALALSVLGVSDGGAAVAGTAATLGERAFSREQERAADRFALALVAAEYGHVAGATDFLERLSSSGRREGVGWLSTHPRSADRVADLEDLARSAGYATAGATTPMDPALRGP